jgi:hypothetical protein
VYPFTEFRGFLPLVELLLKVPAETLAYVCPIGQIMTIAAPQRPVPLNSSEALQGSKNLTNELRTI